jgi:hypothetical protein
VGKAAAVFFVNEIQPLMTAFEALNAWIGEEVVAFEDYTPVPAA